MLDKFDVHYIWSFANWDTKWIIKDEIEHHIVIFDASDVHFKAQFAHRSWTLDIAALNLCLNQAIQVYSLLLVKHSSEYTVAIFIHILIFISMIIGEVFEIQNLI